MQSPVAHSRRQGLKLWIVRVQHQRTRVESATKLQSQKQFSNRIFPGIRIEERQQKKLCSQFTRTYFVEESSTFWISLSRGYVTEENPLSYHTRRSYLLSQHLRPRDWPPSVLKKKKRKKKGFTDNEYELIMRRPT